jgi:hypothetical protein
MNTDDATRNAMTVLPVRNDLHACEQFTQNHGQRIMMGTIFTYDCHYSNLRKQVIAPQLLSLYYYTH